MKILVVSNVRWNSLDSKLAEIRDFFLPNIDITIERINTDYQVIPFLEYEKGKYGVEYDWYDQHVTRLAENHDIVLFVVPTAQWRGTAGRGWRGDNLEGPVELQIGCDEYDSVFQNGSRIGGTFQILTAHEICHALYMIAHLPDRTHELLGATNETFYEGIREVRKVNFPTPNFIDSPTKLQKIIEALRNFINAFSPQVMTSDEIKSESLLDSFCNAIKDYEGWFPPSKEYPAGSRSYRNCNPGNVKYVPGMKLATGKDSRGFAVFAKEEDGLTFLKNMIRNAAQGKSKAYKPDMTILQFFQVYAPSFENTPDKYARTVCTKVGISPNDTLRQLFA